MKGKEHAVNPLKFDEVKVGQLYSEFIRISNEKNASPVDGLTAANLLVGSIFQTIKYQSPDNFSLFVDYAKKNLEMITNTLNENFDNFKKQNQ